MSSNAATVTEYLAGLDPARRAEIETVRDLINSALPAGYREGMGYGMIGWVVPLEVHPDTYNSQPLVYTGLAAQKNHNSLYLNGVYASAGQTDRFKRAWAAAGKKLDMGKSCIRFRRASDLALDVLRDEIASTPPAEFIALYERVKTR